MTKFTLMSFIFYFDGFIYAFEGMIQACIGVECCLYIIAILIDYVYRISVDKNLRIIQR